MLDELINPGKTTRGLRPTKLQHVFLFDAIKGILRGLATNDTPPTYGVVQRMESVAYAMPTTVEIALEMIKYATEWQSHQDAMRTAASAAIDSIPVAQRTVTATLWNGEQQAQDITEILRRYMLRVFNSAPRGLDPAILEMANEFRQKWAWEYQANAPDITTLLPENVSEYFNVFTRANGEVDTQKQVKSAANQFRAARTALIAPISMGCQAFAMLFKLLWRSYDARAAANSAFQKLTKPLDDYARAWRTGRIQNDNARKAHHAHKSLESIKATLDSLSDDLLRGFEADDKIPPVISAYENWVSVRGAAKRDMMTKQTKKKKREKMAAKRQLEQEELADKPLTLYAKNGQIDLCDLLAGLKGRQGHIIIELNMINITKLRQWLNITLGNGPRSRPKLTTRAWADFSGKRDKGINIKYTHGGLTVEAHFLSQPYPLKGAIHRVEFTNG